MNMPVNMSKGVEAESSLWKEKKKKKRQPKMGYRGDQLNGNKKEGTEIFSLDLSWIKAYGLKLTQTYKSESQTIQNKKGFISAVTYTFHSFSGPQAVVNATHIMQEIKSLCVEGSIDL